MVCVSVALVRHGTVVARRLVGIQKGRWPMRMSRHIQALRLCVHPCVRHVGLLFVVAPRSTTAFLSLQGSKAPATSCLRSLVLFVPFGAPSSPRLPARPSFLPRVERRSFTRTETLAPCNSSTYSKGMHLKSVLSSSTAKNRKRLALLLRLLTSLV